MVRKDLIRRTTEVLRANNIRKSISVPEHVFRISDDEGNHKDFSVKKIEKGVLYTVDDVAAIMDACQYVIQEAVKSGEDITVRGFGTLGKRYRKARTVKNVLDGKEVNLKGHYVPCFSPGNDLKRCMQIYEQSLADKEINKPLPIFHMSEV